MLPFLRCVFCCVDEVDTDSHSSSDYYAIPNNYNTYTTTTNSISTPAQTTSSIYSHTYFNCPPKSNTPFVYNQQRQGNVKVDSVITPKKTPTDTHANVFPKKTSDPYAKSSTGQYLFSSSASNLPCEVTAGRVFSAVESSKSASFRSTPKSPSVSNKPILSSAATSTTTIKPDVKVDSVISLKKTPNETHTIVFPRKIINPDVKRSSLSNASSSNLPFKVESPKSVSLSSSSFGASPSTPKSPSVSNKPILSRAAASTNTSNDTKNKYIWVEKGSTPLYEIPEDIKGLIKQDVVPVVLRKTLSPQTYKDYFAALLYAEDYYLEKWDGFEMKNVPLKLHEAEVRSRKDKSNNKNNDVKDDKIFVEFALTSIPEKRPFLLSRDFASVRPSGKKVNPYTGIIFRVVKSNIVLVEFGEDFHAQHYSSSKYDVKFSFNRVCLKRAHQAIAAASDMLFTNFLFPECRPKDNYFSKKVLFRQKLLSSHRLDSEQAAAVSRILNHNGAPPYLLEGPLSVTTEKQLSRTGMVVRGPLSVTREKQLSRTGMVVREAVVELCQASPANRILICAPLNSTCDVFMRSLWKEVGDSNIFRANAAFRELDGVPIDILPFCPYKEKEECFSCPSLPQLLTFKVILSTFMSSFRLHNEGIESGHFSHIFLVDVSSATEPEVMVPLTNLANVSTNVVVTGAPGNQSRWVRSDIARRNGLRISYFERLCGRKLYSDLNPESITQLKDFRENGAYM